MFKTDEKMSTAIKELSQTHAQKFHSKNGFLGTELEFPIVASSPDRLGRALGIEEIMSIYRQIGSSEGWRLSPQGLDIETNLKEGTVSINAEAGFSTMEIAIPPTKTIERTGEIIDQAVAAAGVAVHSHGAYMLGYGIHPVSPPSVDLYCPRDRSTAMRFIRPVLTHIQNDDSDISNTVSASVQFHVGAFDPEHAVRLLNLYNLLSPEFIALSANSRISRGRDSGNTDLRNRFYEMHTQYPASAGVAPRIESFEDYINKLQHMPILLLKRGGRYVVVTDGVTFGQFMERGSATAVYANENKPFIITPEPDDIDVIESMVRWEARIKGTTGTIELRTCSMQQSKSDILALGSVVLGLSANIDEAEALVLGRSRDEAQHAKEQISKYGIKGHKEIRASAHRMLSVAKEGLESLGDKTRYLEILSQRLRDSVTPSDKSLEVYKKEGIAPFIEAVRFSMD